MPLNLPGGGREPPKSAQLNRIFIFILLQKWLSWPQKCRKRHPDHCCNYHRSWNMLIKNFSYIEWQPCWKPYCLPFLIMIVFCICAFNAIKYRKENAFLLVSYLNLRYKFQFCFEKIYSLRFLGSHLENGTHLENGGHLEISLYIDTLLYSNWWRIKIIPNILSDIEMPNQKYIPIFNSWFRLIFDDMAAILKNAPKCLLPRLSWY